MVKTMPTKAAVSRQTPSERGPTMSSCSIVFFQWTLPAPRHRFSQNRRFCYQPNHAQDARRKPAAAREQWKPCRQAGTARRTQRQSGRCTPTLQDAHERLAAQHQRRDAAPQRLRRLAGAHPVPQAAQRRLQRAAPGRRRRRRWVAAPAAAVVCCCCRVCGCRCCLPAAAGPQRGPLQAAASRWRCSGQPGCRRQPDGLLQLLCAASRWHGSYAAGRSERHGHFQLQGFRRRAEPT